MAKPGPKSAAEQLGPIIPGAARPPPPPADLLPAEQAHWTAITGALPPDWFNTANMPLLRQLYRHIRFADELSQDIARQREELATGEPKSDQQQRRLANALRQTLRAHGYQTDRIVSLSTKLRLTKLSRYARADAAYAGAKGAGYPKPWTDWGGRQ